MKLLLQRKIFNSDEHRNCIGELFYFDVDKWKWFCYTLEDEIRAEGQKVYGKTAIPADTYNVRVIFWERHKRLIPNIFNQKDFSINSHGMKFSGVMMHGGNNEEHSLGCVLCAYHTDGVKIWGDASHALTQLLYHEGGNAIHELEIQNQIFAGKLTREIFSL